MSGSAFAESERSNVRWRDEWPRIRTWEYFATAGALGIGFGLRFFGPDPPENWTEPVLFDDAVMDEIALDAPENHQLSGNVGDGMFYGSMAYRLVDSLAVPLIGYGDGDLALQMSIIDLEAFGTVALVLWGSQTFVGRTRPVVPRHCDDPRFNQGFTPECEPDDDNRNRAFIAGHAATVTAAAGVTCMHHGHIPLYGGDADRIACGTMIGAAAMTGIARITTEDHYPTDTLLGWGLGAFAGWFLPAALHYGFGTKRARVSRATTESSASVAPRALVVPWSAGGGAGAALVGVL